MSACIACLRFCAIPACAFTCRPAATTKRRPRRRPPAMIFSALLGPANEVPAVSGSESAGRGAAQIQFDITRDASGAIASATTTFYFQLAGFPAGTTIVGAHIHPLQRVVNGPVIISTELATLNTVTLTSGSRRVHISRDGRRTRRSCSEIINNPSALLLQRPLAPAIRAASRAVQLMSRCR